MKYTVYCPALIVILLTFIIISTGVALSQQATNTTAAAQSQYMGGQDSLLGIVYDSNHDVVPGAQVTIYFTQFIPPSEYKAMGPVNIPDNPQYTGDGSRSPRGQYEFKDLLPDVYAVTAEINGIAYTEDVNVINSTETMDLTIPNYTYQAAANASPIPGGPTYSPPPGWNTTPVPQGGGIDIGDVLKIFLICLVVAQLVVSTAILVVITGRR
jgi:hypothetical protein